MSIRPAPARWARPRPTGKKLATDEDFVTELLEAEGVAVVQGTRVRARPGIPHFLRDQDRRPGRSLPPHPALLRKYEVSPLISVVCEGFGRVHIHFPLCMSPLICGHDSALGLR